LKILFSVLFFAIAFIFSCSDYPRIDEIEHTLKPGGEFTDTRNQEVYKTVIIGDQTWMARNLNYLAPNGNSKCYYNDPDNCEIYGRLYDWATAMDTLNCDTISCNRTDKKRKGICPTGWHLPKEAEWQTLVDYIGPNAAIKLRAKSGWNDSNDNGDDDYGFSAIPSGFCKIKSGNELQCGNIRAEEYGSWWSSTEVLDFPEQAYRRAVADYKNNKDEVSKYNTDKTYMFAVRCIKD